MVLRNLAMFFYFVTMNYENYGHKGLCACIYISKNDNMVGVGKLVSNGIV